MRIHQGLSRVELARQLGIAPSTAGGYVDRLITEGFLFEGRKSERDMGRPPKLLALNPAGGRFIGLDFDAHDLRATAVDFSQRPIGQIQQTISPSDSVEEIIVKIERTIEKLMKADPRSVLGIGIGVPGTIDPKKQIALHYPHIQGWENISLVERLRQRFNVNIYMENNIRTMALAELWFGPERHLETFVCLGIRTGVSAGIVVHRRLLYGRNNLAGEIGDWLCPVMPGRGNNWSCEKLQPLEQIASIPAILEAVRAGLANSKSFLREKKTVAFDDVVQSAQLGDELVIRVLENVAQTLGWVICQINALLNPQKIILAGPLVKLGDIFLQPLENAVRAFSSPRRQGAPVLVDSELGDFNGALGAAALALHEWKPKR